MRGMIKNYSAKFKITFDKFLILIYFFYYRKFLWINFLTLAALSLSKSFMPVKELVEQSGRLQLSSIVGHNFAYLARKFPLLSSHKHLFTVTKTIRKVCNSPTHTHTQIHTHTQSRMRARASLMKLRSNNSYLHE